MATSAEQLKPGTLLNGRYEISRPLGRGGMGTVFLAQHLQLQATLAIKEVCSPGDSEEERQATLEQYQREARFLVQLNHPNLPKVTDAFVENDRFYLVMEFIEGVTLEARLKERGGRPMPVIQVIEWGLQITDVLGYLHTQTPPIVFRDLKPSNVMLKPDNTIRLIDFGIARRFQEGAVQDTALFGSIGYSPPEQFGRQQTDPRSDIYAFGATLHQMLTGIDPAIQPFKFVPVHAVNPAVPQLLSDLIKQCLSMEADARPADAHQVAMTLLAVREMVASLEPEAMEEPNSLYSADALNALTTPGRSASGPSTAGSGPRIISAKLAEADAIRKRSGSQEVAKSAPPKVPPTALPARPRPAGANRVPLLLVAGLLMLTLIAVSGAAYVYSVAHRPPAAPAHPPGPVPITPNPNVGTSAAPPAPAPDDSNSSSSSSIDGSSAVIGRLEIASASIVTAPDNSMMLRMIVRGEVTGSHFESVVLGGYFSDKQGTPIRAKHSSTYSSNGFVIIPDTHIIVNQGRFEQPLDIPLTEFETLTLNGPLQFSCTAIQNNMGLKNSAPYPVQASVFKPFLAQSPAGSPGDSPSAPPNSERRSSSGSLLDGAVTPPGT